MVERRQELFRHGTCDLEEFRPWVALHVTRPMARWELDRRHRFPEDRDTRIGWLAKPRWRAGGARR